MQTNPLSRQTSVGVNVLVNLVHLDVSKNMISSLSGLNQLKLLVHLDVSCNKICLESEVEKLQANTALREL